MSGQSPHGVGTLQGVARGLSGRLGVPGRLGDAGRRWHVRPGGVWLVGGASQRYGRDVVSEPEGARWYVQPA